MNIKTQKVLMFIPIVNGIVIFAWIKFMSKSNIHVKEFAKKLIMLIVAAVMIIVLFAFVVNLFNIDGLLRTLLEDIAFYIVTLIISISAVKFQENYINQN